VSPPAPPAKVLIIKPSSLGDVISGLPVLGGLRRSFPKARLAWLVTPTCADILAGQPGLDEVIGFDRQRYGRIGRSPDAARAFAAFCRELRRRRFDWVIDLQGLFRSAFLAGVTGAAVRAGFADAREFAPVFYTHPVRVSAGHTIDRNIELARGLGVDARPEDLRLHVADLAREFVDSILAAAGMKKGRYLLLAPGTRWRNKMYPPRHWKKVIAELAGQRPVVLAGTGQERPLCQELTEGNGRAVINLAGQTTLPQLVALIASAGGVVCCDSAAVFISAAVGTPLVMLAGPTRPERTGPYGGAARVLQADIPCIGCLKRRCRHVTCMQAIPPASVAVAAREALGMADRPAAPRGKGADG
jgi:heptosyltransferase-1